MPRLPWNRIQIGFPRDGNDQRATARLFGGSTSKGRQAAAAGYDGDRAHLEA
jgi:hypothetical protein